MPLRDDSNLLLDGYEKVSREASNFYFAFYLNSDCLHRDRNRWSAFRASIRIVYHFSLSYVYLKLVYLDKSLLDIYAIYRIFSQFD